MRKFMRTGLIIIITAVIAGGAVYALQTKKLQDERDQLQSDNLALRSKVHDLEAAATATPTPSPSPSPTATPAPTDEELAVKAVKDDCIAGGSDISKGVFSVTKITLPFISVNFSCTAGTADNRAILKKIGTTWTLVHKGTGAPTAAVIKKYAIPKDFQ